jgi:hypothetical protein
LEQFQRSQEKGINTILLSLQEENFHNQNRTTTPQKENVYVGTGADPGFNAQEHTNKALTTGPFDKTCEENEVSPKVEAGVVARLKCLQP